MRNYGTCACGNYQAFGSIAPPPCRSCSKCNTRPGPHGPQPPAAHEFKAKMVDTDEGPKPLSRCIHCLRTTAQIEREREPFKPWTTTGDARTNPICHTLDSKVFPHPEEQEAEAFGGPQMISVGDLGRILQKAAIAPPSEQG